jgi:hypothetical protein
MFTGEATHWPLAFFENRGVPGRHPRAQHRPRLLAAAAGDGAVLPGVAALLHIVLQHVQRGRLTA